MSPRRGTALLILAALVACRASPASSLRIVTLDAVAGLDPHLTNDFHTVTVLGNVYEPLARFGPDGSLEPALAVAWSNPSDDRWRSPKMRPLRTQEAAPASVSGPGGVLAKPSPDLI